MHVYMHMQALANYIADQYRNYRNADISVGLRRPVEMCACVQVYMCMCTCMQARASAILPRRLGRYIAPYFSVCRVNSGGKRADAAI